MDDQGKDELMEHDGASMTLHLQIPNNAVGSVIGKQGEVIKSIREQSRARVIIAESQLGVEDRDFTIKGSLSSVDQAVNSILASISQVRVQNFNGSEQSAETDSLSVKLLVANDQCGAIIGKGGDVIKHLREDSGARISIGKKVDFIRTIVVSGNHSSCQAAFGALIRLIHEHPSSARDPFLHGFRNQSSSYRSNQPLFNYGTSGMQSSLGVPYPSGNLPYGLTQSSAGNGLIDSSVYSADTSATLSIPNRSIGAIIGKRGQTINEIRNMSGCRIDIASSSDNSQFRTITLSGSSQSIELAQMLIQKATYRLPYE